jgi:hypothetical protein
MQIDDVYLVSNKLELATEEDIEQLETALATPLPRGYADFVSKLGVGTYCDILRVYSPARILTEYADVRKRWDEYFFWEVGRDVLTREQALRCVIFADTIDGDEIIARPDMPDRLFVLPRHDELIYWIPGSFDSPLTWQGSSGAVMREPTFRYFESWRDREYREFFTAKEMFSIADLAPYFSDFWEQFGKTVTRLPREKDEDADENVAILFVREIAARIQLVQSLPDDKRMSVRIDYDADSESDVAIFGTFLTDMGFYETSSSISDSKNPIP